MNAVVCLLVLLATFALGYRVGDRRQRGSELERGRWQTFTDKLAADNQTLRGLLAARGRLSSPIASAANVPAPPAPVPELAREAFEERTLVSPSPKLGPSSRRVEAGTTVINALGHLRARLEVGQHEVAARMSIPQREVGEIEIAPLGELKVGIVSRFVGALGCRLDVVAVHIDGLTEWLSDHEVTS